MSVVSTAHWAQVAVPNPIPDALLIDAQGDKLIIDGAGDVLLIDNGVWAPSAVAAVTWTAT